MTTDISLHEKLADIGLSMEALGSRDAYLINGFIVTGRDIRLHNLNTAEKLSDFLMERALAFKEKCYVKNSNQDL